MNHIAVAFQASVVSPLHICSAWLATASEFWRSMISNVRVVATAYHRTSARFFGNGLARRSLKGCRRHVLARRFSDVSSLSLSSALALCSGSLPLACPDARLGTSRKPSWGICHWGVGWGSCRDCKGSIRSRLVHLAARRDVAVLSVQKRIIYDRESIEEKLVDRTGHSLVMCGKAEC